MKPKVRSYIKDWDNIPYDFNHITSKFRVLLGRCGFKHTSKYNQSPVIYTHVLTGATVSICKVTRTQSMSGVTSIEKNYRFQYGNKSVELNVRSTMSKDEVFIALSEFMDKCGMRRIFKYSVNSTNYTVMRSLSNFCKKHNLDPRDEDFLTKYYEIKEDKLTYKQKLMKECIHDIFGDNINCKEATAILVRLMIMSPQSKFNSVNSFFYNKKVRPKKMYNINRNINLELSYKQFNALLHFLKLPPINKTEFHFNLPDEFKFKGERYEY